MCGDVDMWICGLGGRNGIRLRAKWLCRQPSLAIV